MVPHGDHCRNFKVLSLHSLDGLRKTTKDRPPTSTSSVVQKVAANLPTLQPSGNKNNFAQAYSHRNFLTRETCRI
jgi:hypothetical protein